MVKKIFYWIKENWWQIGWQHAFLCLLFIIILYFAVGEIKYRYQKNHIEKLSPKTIANLYVKAMYRNDYDLLERIIHPNNSVFHINREPEEWQKWEDFAAKFFGIIMGAKRKVSYQKTIDSNTAEVGFVHYSIYWPFTKYPSGQDILKKHDGIWKMFGFKWVNGKMLEELKKNPNDFSLYYYCAQDMANSQNRLLAYRFRKKYFELDPDGFWITNLFLEQLKIDEENYETNYKSYEKQLLAEIENSSGSWASLHKARIYITLARLFMFHQDYQKAEHYLNQAENASRQDQYTKDSFDHASNEFQLRKEGKYIDPIEELDKLRLSAQPKPEQLSLDSL